MVLTKEEKARLVFAAFLSDNKEKGEDKSQQKPNVELVGLAPSPPPAPTFRLDGKPERGSTSSETQKPNRFFKPYSDRIVQDVLIQVKEQVKQRVASDNECREKFDKYVAELQDFMEHNPQPSEKDFSDFLDHVFREEKDFETAHAYFLLVLHKLEKEYGTGFIWLCDCYHLEKFEEQSSKLYDQNCNLKGTI